MGIYTDQEQDGNLIDNSTKTDLIVEIKEIIDNYGTFGVGEVEASCSPSVPNQKGNLNHLIEHFNKESVDVEVWSEQLGESVDDYSLTYEELDVETLEEILELCQAWQEINTEE
jgi:hypothetical protein